MKVLTKPLWEMGEMEEVHHLLLDRKGSVLVSGCADSQKLHMAYGLSDGFSCKIIVTFSDQRVKEIYEDYKIYDKNVMMFPGKDLIFYQADIHGNQLITERMKCYRRILSDPNVTIVTTFHALMTPQVPLQVMKDSCILFSKNKAVDSSKLALKLISMGYDKTYQVEGKGQFSIRGGIIDIFDLTEENPYRIELWGDDVDSIRSFDLSTQRSIENKKEITIFPATEMILDENRIFDGLQRIEKDAKNQEEKLRKLFKTEEAHRIHTQMKELKEQVEEFKSYANLESYIHYFYKETQTFLNFFEYPNTLLIFDEPSRIKEHGEAVELEFRESMSHRGEKGYVLPGQMNLLQSMDKTLAEVQKFALLTLQSIQTRQQLVKTDRLVDVVTKSIASYNHSFEALVKDLEKYKKNGYRILLMSPSRTRAQRLAQDLMDLDLPAIYSEDMDRELIAGEIMTCYGNLQKGFEYPFIKFVVIAESDIFGIEKKTKKKKTYEGQKINDFQDLKVGDYVVHENHGLGIYKGIEKVEVEKVIKDYMKIEYRDGGNLYILATGFHVIQKYASADAKRPKLNKLGGKEWINTKTKVKGAVAEVAKDLVELYAKRQETAGYVFGKDTVWQREFEELFPFEETGDQLEAIEATKRDMESSKIMDRLICGDVGYGKTEVAIRAAFKAVQEGKQVVYLVPTTILAQQHYNTFVQRMKDFPVNIELMSRFRTPSQQKKTLEGLKKGQVDIVVGTHRVLSSDLKFKDLGLLIVDEEQRFGVTHKEKIKKMKDSVDVLTLTATPIPRTLHMSLIGIRDMSVLEEPPHDRMAIQTYVMEFNEELVREAIVRELSRGGQVYYVYNRVSTIADTATMIQKLVPEANVSFAHGQMKESELERIMFDFIEGEIDVLVSTTIIETGLDISNVNTMIIHDSDNLGLSQLYQLRGRVGRSNRTAYAFLMYKKNKLLKEVAEKRLQAIREFTELGSGFKIAMRDLEIRGAGNLLGQKQHGHMEAVGYDLYCKMLNEAVKGLKGIQSFEDFNTQVDLDVDAYIPGEYIINEIQKLDIYKRIAGIETILESNDMKEELLDRFGSIPKSVDNLLRIAMIRVNAHKLYITDLQGKNQVVKIVLDKKAQVDAARIPIFMKLYGNRIKFQAKGDPTFLCTYAKTGILEKDAEQLLTLSEKLVEDMKMLLL